MRAPVGVRKRALGVTIIGSLLAVTNVASAATLKADYQLQGTLASSISGAPSLSNVGPGTNVFETDTVFGFSQRVLAFPKNNGLSLSSTSTIIPNGDYSIVMLFELASTSGYNRLFDFADGTVDNGFYDLNGTLYLYPHAASAVQRVITPNSYVQVAITRDATGAVVGYVNRTLVVGPYDDSSSGDALITPANVLRFFIDDTSVSGEDSAGRVARIRIYQGALTAREVLALAPSVAPPVLGKTVDGAPVSGTVLVRLPGTATSAALGKGNGFVPLTTARQLPVGTQVDARAGSLRLVTASGHVGKTQSGVFGGGAFKLAQDRTGFTKGLTTLTMLEGGFPGAPSYTSCSHAAGHSSLAQSAKVAPKVLQTLRAHDSHGQFRTKGKYSAATVRGTEWDTVDRCDGTLTIVHRGTVRVTDFRLRRTVTVHEGHRYLAKARP